MRKVFRFIGVASVTLMLFFIVASLAFYHLIRIGEFRRFLVAEIEKNSDDPALVEKVGALTRWLVSARSAG